MFLIPFLSRCCFVFCLLVPGGIFYINFSHHQKRFFWSHNTRAHTSSYIYKNSPKPFEIKSCFVYIEFHPYQKTEKVSDYVATRDWRVTDNKITRFASLNDNKFQNTWSIISPTKLEHIGKGCSEVDVAVRGSDIQMYYYSLYLNSFFENANLFNHFRETEQQNSVHCFSGVNWFLKGKII